MVYTCIFVIRGFVLSKNDVCSIKNIDPTNEDDFCKLCEKHTGGITPFLGQLGLHTWPCCSELHEKKFIVGKVIADYNIGEIFNDYVTTNLKSNYKFDSEIKHFSKKFGKSDLIKNYLLLDDCTWCS